MIRFCLALSVVLASGCGNDETTSSSNATDKAVARDATKAIETKPSANSPSPSANSGSVKPEQAPRPQLDCANLLAAAEVNERCGGTFTGEKTSLERADQTECNRKFSAGESWKSPAVHWSTRSMGERGAHWDINDRKKGGATPVAGLGSLAVSQAEDGQTEIVFARKGHHVIVRSKTCAEAKLIELAKLLDQRL